MKKLSLTLLMPLLAIFGLLAQNANVQVIHNSPDPAVATVDIYVNGALLPQLDDFEFREATPFLPVGAGSPVNVGIALSNSTGVADTLVNVQLPALMAGTNYVLLAVGLVDTTLATNPEGISTAFQLSVVGNAQVSAPAGNANILISHGAPDAPSVNVNVLDANQSPVASVDSIPFKGFSEVGGNVSYVQLPANDGFVNLTVSATGDDIATYYAPLSALDQAGAVVFASGFVGQGSFGLYVATPAGDVIKLPVIGTGVQIIHNSADPAAAEVDVYVVEKFTGNDAVISFFDDFAFREATVYLPFPSELPFRVYVAPSNSTSIADSLASFDYPAGLEVGKLYSIIANGVLNPGDFAANPSGASTAFDLYVYDEARAQAVPNTNVDVLAFHGATDAPAVDIDLRELPGTEVEDISYGEFSPNGYAGFTPADVTVDVKNNATQDVLVSYSASLSVAGGAAVTVFASGFLDTAANQDGAPFGLFAALPINFANPNATLATVLPLPLFEEEDTLNVLTPEAEIFNDINLYPNPSSDYLNVNYNLKESGDFEIRFVDVNGRMITRRDLGTVSPGSNNVEFNVSTLAPGTYFMQMIIDNKGYVVKPVVVGTK